MQLKLHKVCLVDKKKTFNAITDNNKICIHILEINKYFYKQAILTFVKHIGINVSILA